MKGGAHLSPLATLSFPDLTEVNIYCSTDRVFMSPKIEIVLWSHDLSATQFCAVTESLYLFGYGASEQELPILLCNVI